MNTHRMSRLLLFLFGLSLLGCEVLPDALTKSQEDASLRQAAPGAAFEVAVGETVAVTGTGLQVTFEAVEGDSRCPQDVDCIWAGEAAVRLRVTAGQEASTLVLTLPGLVTPPFDQNEKVAAGAYDLQLLDLQPYPQAGQDIPASAYRATLVVRER
jgi:hypothetical protein